VSGAQRLTPHRAGRLPRPAVGRLPEVFLLVFPLPALLPVALLPVALLPAVLPPAVRLPAVRLPAVQLPVELLLVEPPPLVLLPAVRLPVALLPVALLLAVLLLAVLLLAVLLPAVLLPVELLLVELPPLVLLSLVLLPAVRPRAAQPRAALLLDWLRPVVPRLVLPPPVVRPPRAQPRDVPLLDGLRPAVPPPVLLPAVVPPDWRDRARPFQQLAPARRRQSLEAVRWQAAGSRLLALPRPQALEPLQGRAQTPLPHRAAQRRSPAARESPGAPRHRTDRRAQELSWQGPRRSQTRSLDRLLPWDWSAARSPLRPAAEPPQQVWMASHSVYRQQTARPARSATARCPAAEPA